MVSTHRAACVMAATLCAVLAGAACGKKGGPLAPFVRIPAAVTTITATRLGNDVYVTLTVPARNIDNSLPGDVGYIEVYAYTGRAAPLPARFVELGELVATIPVAPPPLPGAPVPAVPPAGAAAPLADQQGALQGTPVTVRDVLTADELVQGPVPPPDPRRPALVGALGLPLTGALKRFYLAVPFSQRGRPGPPGTATELVLTALPDPPTNLRATYTPNGVTLTWEPSGGLLGFLLDAPLAPEPLPFDLPPVVGPVVPPVADPGVPPGPTGYPVFRVLAPDPLALPAPVGAPPGTETTPVAINPLTDPIEFGRERCYTVRAQRGVAPNVVMSEPSPPLCITPIDTFPPAVPLGLAAVPSEGGISLIWEPNSEMDLGGYLVLRREGVDATLRLLTDTPIADARFRDTAVTPGTRYTYSVVAVDSQLPLPNVSGESAQVEETAR